MEMCFADSIKILERTPVTLNYLLRDLPESLTHSNEGGNSWSPFDVIGHLIHGEKTDWMPRLRIILAHGENRPFDTFDRFAQFENSKGKSLPELLDRFAELRKENLDALRSLELTQSSLNLTGIHPELGKVTLGQLLATWTVHDLGHIVQAARTMAKRFTENVGPWKAYLSVLTR